MILLLSMLVNTYYHIIYSEKVLFAGWMWIASSITRYSYALVLRNNGWTMHNVIIFDRAILVYYLICMHGPAIGIAILYIMSTCYNRIYLKVMAHALMTITAL